MSSLSSLEVFRPVLLPVGATLYEDITSAARSIYDVDGNNVVSVRPSNLTYRTTRIGVQTVAEQDLHYPHLCCAGYNVKRFGKKIVDLRDKLENGPKQDSVPEGRTPEERAGTEPIEKTLGSLMLEEYSLDPDNDFIEAKLSEVVVIEDIVKNPGEKLFGFVMQGDELSTESMLRRMSYITRIAMGRHTSNPNVLKSELTQRADVIVFASTKILNCQLEKELIATGNELLYNNVQSSGYTVQLGPIEFLTTY